MNLETNIVGESFVVMQKDSKTNVSICGSSKYLESLPLILKGPEDFELIKSKEPNQEILYDLNREWSIADARLYLNALLEAHELLKNTTILEIARYRIEQEDNYSKYQRCEAFRRRNLVGMSDYNNTKCKPLVLLSDKCAYCPIGFRCPVCNCINKDNICYMHQAECIAALMISQIEDYKPEWILQILIPESWAMKFGFRTHKRIREIRSQIYNTFYTSDLVSNIKVTVYNSECHLLDYMKLKHFLSFSPLRYNETQVDNNFILEFYVDKNTFDSIKNHVADSIIYHKEGIDIKQEPYDEVFSVRDITFGNPASGADIIDIGSKTLGDPRNLYTYSILYCMRDYINNSTKRVLDIGCGRGTTSLYAKKCGAWQVYSMDIKEECFKETMAMYMASSEWDFNLEQTIVHQEDIFTFINYHKGLPTDYQFDVIIGNLHYDIQKDLLPRVSSILKDGGIYIMGGIPILIENAVLKISIDNDLELIDSRYFYNSAILIFQKRKEF